MRSKAEKIVDKIAATPVADLAAQIKAIDEAYQRIEAGPLKRRAILILLKDLSGLPITTIEIVLDSLSRLRREFVK